ncbi:DUF4124 domain-containing protein [Xylophilus rhododendri]|uniref:DUF4124 domain-containing protein n=1 Tax=Xylophilus rhododendri TaxID=2697032 RepID=A0A857J1F2_9BURK|nr:DUF4124 domain-containing protein [Xylophilus rhododendri]QHI96798.1 DUF4124 domain-containing protein [Xylophilus rhododendri]
MTVAPAARYLVMFTLACAAGAASAQYMWLDAAGRKVYSDRPPPIEVPERSILRKPRGPSTADPAPVAAPAPAPTAAATPGKPGAPAKPGGKDSELEERRKQAEAADAAKRQAEEARNAAARADNCQRAQQSAATLNSGVRISQINAQGERSYMDEQTRAAEAQRAQSLIASECR